MLSKQIISIRPSFKKGINRDSYIVVHQNLIFLRVIINEYGRYHPSYTVVTSIVGGDGLRIYPDKEHLLSTAIATVQSFGATAYISKNKMGDQTVKLANAINNDELTLLLTRFFQILYENAELQIEIMPE